MGIASFENVSQAASEDALVVDILATWGGSGWWGHTCLLICSVSGYIARPKTQCGPKGHCVRLAFIYLTKNRLPTLRRDFSNASCTAKRGTVGCAPDKGIHLLVFYVQPGPETEELFARCSRCGPQGTIEFDTPSFPSVQVFRSSQEEKTQGVLQWK